MQILQDDITRLQFDIIVNAANSSLLGGGGVDGAVHRAAGPKLLEECRTLGGCPTGQAKITQGYNLPAKHIIHTVGPIYDETPDAPALLRSCYLESLKLAEKIAANAIAFPCISTGIYGYPREEACGIAVSTVVEWLSTHELPHHVTFCCFSQEDANHYHARLAI